MDRTASGIRWQGVFRLAMGKATPFGILSIRFGRCERSI
jgi:hypothetical protein